MVMVLPVNVLTKMAAFEDEIYDNPSRAFFILIR